MVFVGSRMHSEQRKDFVGLNAKEQAVANVLISGDLSITITKLHVGKRKENREQDKEVLVLARCWRGVLCR